MDGYAILNEALKSSNRFVVHKHNPRSWSQHFDVRFLYPKNPKLLPSFAAPSDFLNTASKKTLLVKTRDHDPRWLDLKSHRLELIDQGMVTFKVTTSKYFELIFEGKVLSGPYKLFKVKSRRNDNWVLIKKHWS